MRWILPEIVTREVGLTSGQLRGIIDTHSALVVLQSDLFSEFRLRRRMKPRNRCSDIKPGPRVYFLFDDGILVYVGKSRNTAARLADHRMPFDHFATVRCSDVLLDSIEAAYIAKFLPRRNIKRERHTLGYQMRL